MKLTKQKKGYFKLETNVGTLAFEKTFLSERVGWITIVTSHKRAPGF